MTLTPAYGRDYNSKKAVLTDWAADKDFVVNDMASASFGPYINQTDAKIQGIREITFRYANLTKSFVHKMG